MSTSGELTVFRSAAAPWRHDLSGQFVVITGGARGQGAEEARAFHSCGARVLVGDILDDVGGALVDSLGDGASYVHLDVTDERSWAALVAEVESAGAPLTTLVNNAGIVKGGTPIVETAVADLERILDVNLLGCLLGIKWCAPLMTSGGSIVNISSISGLTGMTGLGAYVASKWALRGLTRSAAAELGPRGIRVNSVHPGVIDTPMLDQGAGGVDGSLERNAGLLLLARIGLPRDIAHMVLFLSSDEAAYVTGAELVVDGGWSA